jgi:formylglycine-generating enzyme required for sulfatase activity
MSGVVTVRIFLASPQSDTVLAREAVVKAVRAIGADPAYRRRFQLDLLRWDDAMRGLVFEAAGSPQRAIEVQIGKPGECDLVIGLFAHTMGGFLDVAHYGKHQKEDRPWHCTEWEIQEALEGRKAGRVREVWLYKEDSDQPAPDRRLSPDEKDAHCKRSTDVERFLEKLSPNLFTDPASLLEQMGLALRNWLNRQWPEAAGGGAVETPAVKPLDQPDLRPYLTRRRDHWRSTDAGQLDRRFVNLSLMIDHGLAHDGPRHTQEARFDRLGDLLAKRPDVGAWVLVGDPGGGKSTILQHHEMTAAAAALADEAGALPELCVWQRLSTYSHDSPPPAEWLAQHWPADLPTLAALRGVARVRLLLDGLNEIKAPDRARQLDAIDRWTEWAARLAHQGDHLLAPIFSVRTLDQSPLSTGDFEVRQIVVWRWSREQVRDYCAQMLGEGNALWPAIEKDERDGHGHLLALSTLPFNLRAQCELFGALGEVVREPARLMGGLFWLRLRNQVRTAPLKVPGLIGEDDVLALSGDRWKERLTELPEEGCLVPWLDDRAQGLQRLGRQVSVSKRELLKALPSHDPSCAPADWLKAVGALQLIDEGSGDQTALRRFSHQLWQEFFAARGLRDLPTCAPERLPDLRPPALAPLDEVLAKLGVQEPLPGPDPSHWEEPVKLAVQLVPDPLAWVRALEPVNLALAGRAAVACQEKAEALHGAAVFDDLRQALLTRSRDAKVDLRLRIEAGLVLGDLGDPRYEKREGLQEKCKYLWPRQWVTVPAGGYVLGSKDGYADETPLTSVHLEEFQMAFAPVTNAEFRCFVDAKGYEDERWWHGEAAQRWRREGIRNDERINYWRPRFAALRADFDAAVQQYFAHETRSYIEGELRRYAKWTEEEAEEALEADFGARVRRSPGSFERLMFDRPNQPVCEISLFEAAAYARWLSAQTGEEVRLPTEAEWEAAARGKGPGRKWPWGSRSEPEHWRMNADPAHIRRTSPVGAFVESDTPDGLVDMAGNVWEWTSSAYTERYDPVSPITACQDDSARRVVRGGAWDYSTEYCRASVRYTVDPDYRYTSSWGCGWCGGGGCPIQNPVPRTIAQAMQPPYDEPQPCHTARAVALCGCGATRYRPGGSCAAGRGTTPPRTAVRPIATRTIPTIATTTWGCGWCGGGGCHIPKSDGGNARRSRSARRASGF